MSELLRKLEFLIVLKEAHKLPVEAYCSTQGVAERLTVSSG